MTNRFYEAQDMYNSSDFTFNPLNGLNEAGSPQSKITIKGDLDDFTIATLYQNYERISHNLKVYPTIVIYPRDYTLNGGMGGFYHSDHNHIDMIDHYYLIRILSHEMRHAFQYIYFPDLFFATDYHSPGEYLNCEIERDARGYSLDYCTAAEYWEEAAYIRGEEEEFEQVIHNQLAPVSVGLNEAYFSQNPTVASSVPRNFHWIQPQEDTVHSSDPSSVGGFFATVKGLGKLIFIIWIVWVLVKDL